MAIGKQCVLKNGNACPAARRLHRVCSLCDLGWWRLAAHVMHRRIGQRHAVLRSSCRPPPTGPFSLKSPASWGQAVARSRGHSCGGGPHRRPPFAERAPSTSQRATPLRTPGSESWCPTPSRDGHLIRAALVGIQPEVCRSATTGERRRAAINRGRWRDRSSLPPGRRLSRGRQALPSRWWSRGHAIAGDDLPRIVGRSRCDFASAR